MIETSNFEKLYAVSNNGVTFKGRGKWSGIEEQDGMIIVRYYLKPHKKSCSRCVLALPKKNWNGCFLGLGNGGMAGKVLENTILNWAQKGYATCQTDMGTSKGRDAGYNNPEMWKDFGWRSTHLMTLSAKEFITLYYGKAPKHSYFLGASTGGEQSFSECQRFPEDYEGIIAGVPVTERVALHTYFLWNYRHLMRDDGTPKITHEEIAYIHRFAVEFMQKKKDGEPGDCFVTMPKYDKSTVTSFLHYLSHKMHLTEEQQEALFHVYYGPHDPVTGRRIYGGLPMGAELHWCGLGMIDKNEPPEFYPFIWAFGPDYDYRSFDFHEDYALIKKKLSKHLDAADPHIEEFHKLGHHLYAYAGSEDPCVPFHGSLNLFRATQKVLGVEETDECFRYFIMPGKEHSIHGSGINHWFTIDPKKPKELHDDVDTIRLWCDGTTKEFSVYGYHQNLEDPNAPITMNRIVPRIK